MREKLCHQVLQWILQLAVAQAIEGAVPKLGHDLWQFWGCFIFNSSIVRVFSIFRTQTMINTRLHAWWTAPIIAIHLIKHQQIHVKLIRNQNCCFCFEVDVKIASDGPHIVLSNTPSSAFSPALESFPTSFRVKWVAEINQSERYRVDASGTSPILSLSCDFNFAINSGRTGECKCFCQPCHPRGADRVAVSCLERKISETNRLKSNRSGGS